MSHDLPDWYPDWAARPVSTSASASRPRNDAPGNAPPSLPGQTPHSPRNVSPLPTSIGLAPESPVDRPRTASIRNDGAKDGEPTPVSLRAASPLPSPHGLAVEEGLLSPASKSATRSVSRTDRESVEPEEEGFTFNQPRHIIVTPNQDRLVKRELRGIHLFMITINATLGTGLYWRGGQILELGGPLAVLLAFLIVGILAWAVMQCITEMLCIWPIPGAMSVYVSEFVDTELGIAVGVAYWFTYSVSFAALVATTAAEFDFWKEMRENNGLDGGVVYFLIPLCLIAINAFGIKIYGWIEVFFGSVKIIMLLIIIVTLIAINAGAGHNPRAHMGTEYWSRATSYDTAAAKNWGNALMMCLSIATFAYVGVEIIAASALEAKWPKRRHTEDRIDSDISRRSNDTLIGSSVKFSSIWISVLAAVAYSLSGVLVSLDIPRDDCQLPRLSWVRGATECSHDGGEEANTASAFVVIAQQSLIPHLSDVFNSFLIFTALTCANTNLYVASRTLFGLTSRLEGGKGQPWMIRILAWFGKTNRRKVPMRAMIFSAVAFWWVPFLQLADGTGSETPVGMFIEILAEMGSVGVLIVWACQCLAFIRYYHCIDRHRGAIQAQKISQVRRWDKDDWKDYPYRSHGQPFVAYLALAGCLAVIVVANGAALWNGFEKMPFLSSYLIVFVFIALWVLLKLFRGAKWSFVDLSKANLVIKKLKDLHDIRLGAT